MGEAGTRPPANFPGFDGIRLLAAWAVVYSHSYPIARGLGAADPLIAVLGDQSGFGDYAVQVFFILSGFLLSASLDARTDPLRYLVNRLFRIVPGFCFATAVSVLVIAPFLSDLSFWGILTSTEGWSSIYWSIEGLNDLTALTLSAVRDPALRGFLNGSLWSIPYELVYYLLLLSLFMVLRKDSRVAVAAFFLSAVTFAGPRLGLTTTDWSGNTPGLLKLPFAMFDHTLPYFCGGVFFYAIYKRWGAPMTLVAPAAALLLGSIVFRAHDEVLAFAGPVLLVSLGSRPGILSRVTERIGDVSYGVYLFGWPVGLLAATRANTANPLVVFALSVPVVFAFAYAMHRLVEVPVNVSVKPWVFRWLPRLPIGGRCGESRRATCAELAAGRASAARALASGFCLVMVARFVIYPYPFGSNWFGSQVYQLLGICAVTALIVKAGDFWESRGSLAVPVTAVGTSPDQA